MKRQEFFNSLIDELNFLKPEEISQIISDYDKDIKKRVKKGEKEKNILLSFGKPEDISDEIYKEKRNQKIDALKEKIYNFSKKVTGIFKKKQKKIKKKIKKKVVKNKIKKEIEKSNSVLKDIILYLLIIIFFLNNVIFFILLIAFVDGIRIIGPIIASFGLSLILLLLIINNDNYYNYKSLNKNIRIIITIFIVLVFGFGISYSTYEIYNMDFVQNVSDKYVMTKTVKKIKVENSVKNYHIYLNSFYKTNYEIVIDDKLGRDIELQAKYYERLNDFNYKNSVDTLYISLYENPRDVISFYIENLRENKIYNYKELTRYEVIISMSSEIKGIVKIHN